MNEPAQSASRVWLNEEVLVWALPFKLFPHIVPHLSVTHFVIGPLCPTSCLITLRPSQTPDHFLLQVITLLLGTGLYVPLLCTAVQSSGSGMGKWSTRSGDQQELSLRCWWIWEGFQDQLMSLGMLGHCNSVGVPRVDPKGAEILTSSWGPS